MLPGFIPHQIGKQIAVDITNPAAGFQTFSFSLSTTASRSDLNLGTEAADRYIYACVLWEQNFEIDGVEINGVTLTMAVESINTVASPDLGVSIWYGLIPTGTTSISGTITASVLNSQSCSLFIYRVVGADPTALAFDTGVDADTGATQSTTVDVPFGGGVIAVAANTDDAQSWTAAAGVTEDADSDVGAFRAGVASTEVAAGETGRTVSMTAGTNTNSKAFAVVAIG